MQSLKLFVKKLLAYLPTKLPVGRTEFDTWADSILELSGRYADEDSMRFALATMIIHSDARHGALSKNYFLTRLRKTAANQVAAQVFQDIKIKQSQPKDITPAEETTAATDAQKE